MLYETSKKQRQRQRQHRRLQLNSTACIGVKKWLLATCETTTTTTLSSSNK